jgi:adenylate cyclase class 2
VFSISKTYQLDHQRFMANSNAANLEVELKFPLTDPSDVVATLDRLGATWRETITQIDGYFAHPSRDFVQTDEAFRVRAVGEQNYITYKGPKLDITTKTRREIEIPYAAGTASQQQCVALFEALGFRLVGEVRKQRRGGSLVWQNREIELALDEVAGLGSYLELEIIASAAELAAAKELLQSLAGELNLGPSERRGYLDLLMRGK